MFDRIGSTVGRRPLLVILSWVAVLVALIGVGVGYAGAHHWNRADSRQASVLPDSYESARAQHLADTAFGRASDNGTATLVFSRPDHQALSADDVARADRVVDRLDEQAAQRHSPAAVKLVTGPELLSPNHRVLLAQAVFDAPTSDGKAQQEATALAKDARAATEGTALQAHLTGETAGAADNAAQSALVTYAMIGVILLLLLVLFRSVLVAVSSLLVIALVGTGVSGLLTIGAHLVGARIGTTVTELLPVVLFGVGTDYVVFLLFRYRERLRAGDDHRTAVAAGIGRVGEAVLSSALAVAVSFAALLASHMSDFRLLGPALGVAVLVMLMASLTLFPAVFALLGRRLSRRKSWRRTPRAGVSAAVGRLVARRPAAVAGVSALLLAALAAIALGYKADYTITPYQHGSQSAQGYAELTSGFPVGALEPTQVMVASDSGALTPQRLAPYVGELAHVPGVGSAQVARISADARTAEVDLSLTADPTSSGALHDLTEVIGPAAHSHAPEGTRVEVGGTTAAFADTRDVVNHDLKVIIPIAAVAIGIILVLMLRAVAAPAYLMGAVGLGFAATLGSAVLLFQHIEHHPGVLFSVPLIVYLFVASIGTDYNILMIARLREEMKAGASPREAARRAVTQAGPSVGAAGVILAASFGVLGFDSGTAAIGLPVAMGVLLSTFVMSWLLIPAVTALVGRKAFWPSGTGRDTAAPQVPQVQEAPQGIAGPHEPVVHRG
ncbi:MMPL family transporter [Kitasatospora sp. NPDC059571]|uniref:MMPL family transporter n=1 Tax=Kitasatospora sp. NPDC059571 TaxID=3346871 RepID=UPI0036B0758B